MNNSFVLFDVSMEIPAGYNFSEGIQVTHKIAFPSGEDSFTRG